MVGSSAPKTGAEVEAELWVPSRVNVVLGFAKEGMNSVISFKGIDGCE